MKYIFKIFKGTAGGVVFLALFSSVQAQGDTPVRNQIKANLTEEQKELIQANHSAIAETREALKASLTREQIEMLRNNALTLEQKRANLRATLSAQQKQLLNDNRQKSNVQIRMLRKTLTIQQKQMMKRAYFKRLKNANVKPGLKRLPHRIPRWRR